MSLHIEKQLQMHKTGLAIDSISHGPTGRVYSQLLSREPNLLAFGVSWCRGSVAIGIPTAIKETTRRN